jgi:Domain of unknown function (DUF4878)
MKKSLGPVVLVAAILGGSLTGCNQVASIVPGNSPGAVVTAAMMAGNDGKYSEVEKYLSTDCAKLLKGDLGQMAGGIRGWMDKDTRKGTIIKIEVVKENVRGEGAEVISLFHFKDGSTTEDHTHTIKENGSWRVSCS